MIERFARVLPARFNPWSATTATTKLRLPTYSPGGSNLEILKFGMYIMFPISWMYYFGTNLENRFSVPDFWPGPEATHKIPFEKEEQLEMVSKLKAARLEKRQKRLEAEQHFGAATDREKYVEGIEKGTVGTIQELMGRSAEDPRDGRNQNVFRLGTIDRWARGEQ